MAVAGACRYARREEFRSGRNPRFDRVRHLFNAVSPHGPQHLDASGGADAQSAGPRRGERLIGDPVALIIHLKSLILAASLTLAALPVFNTRPLKAR